MEPGWVVVQSYPNREKRASEEIKDLGYETFLPILRPDKRINLRPRPLFSSYMFVHVVDYWHDIVEIEYVNRILMTASGLPAKIKSQFIDELRKRVGKDGMIGIPRPARFQKDQPVRVICGSFTNHVGLFANDGPREFVRILISLLGGQVGVVIDPRHLEPA